MNHIKGVPKRIIEHFKQELKLIKKVVFKDTGIELTEKSYSTKKITFYGAVIKPTDNELIILESIGLKDIKNTFKVYTLYKDIAEGDMVIISSKSFSVWIFNNHYDRKLDYLELFVSQEAK